MADSIIMRRGTHDDEEWLFQLFRQTMQDYIDRAWGWQELLQREGFVTSLPSAGFQILEVNSNPVGSYHITDKKDRLELDMLLVEPLQQRRGYGTLMINQAKDHARQSQKPILLSVLKSNPALQFHLNSGFIQTAADEHSVRMCWQQAQSSATEQ